MIRRLMPAAALLALTGCATLQPAVPQGYVGPIAQVTDSLILSQMTRSNFCILEAINGQDIANSIRSTTEKSRGSGARLQTVVVTRDVPAQKMKATVRCSTVVGAPIMGLFGKVYDVKGEVDFEPKPDVAYRVSGQLNDKGTAVWIEEKESRERVTEKVEGKPG